MAPIRVIGRKQKLFELLGSEEGNADRGKALSAGAVLGGSVLAQMLLAPAAEAHACGMGHPLNCSGLNSAECNDMGCTPVGTGGEFTCEHP